MVLEAFGALDHADAEQLEARDASKDGGTVSQHLHNADKDLAAKTPVAVSPPGIGRNLDHGSSGAEPTSPLTGRRSSAPDSTDGPDDTPTKLSNPDGALRRKLRD